MAQGGIGPQVSRRLIAGTPVLLILGIIAQAILLVLLVVIIVPCLIWPRLLDKPYTWITGGMARFMARSIIRRGKPKAEMVA